MTIPAVTVFCDSCKGAAQDEVGIELDEDSEALLLIDMGAEIPDHLCDAREYPEPGVYVRCDCACNHYKNL